MSMQLTDSQKQAIQLALDFATSDNKILNIVGDAYTGKTTLVPYLVKELESFLNVYSSIIGEETEVMVLSVNNRLGMEYLMNGINYTHLSSILPMPLKPVIYIVDYSEYDPALTDRYPYYLDDPDTKFILLTRVANPSTQSFRLDPITEPVKPVRLNRDEFTAKLKEDIIKDPSDTVYVTALDSGNVIDYRMDFLDKSKIAPNTLLKDHLGVYHIFESYKHTTFNSSSCGVYVLSDASAEDTNKKYILDGATISPELGQYIENAPCVDYLYVDSILTPDDIIGLKFKNVYLHSEDSNSTSRHLQKVLGSALENLYILEG